MLDLVVPVDGSLTGFCFSVNVENDVVDMH